MIAVKAEPLIVPVPLAASIVAISVALATPVSVLLKLVGSVSKSVIA